MEAKFLSNVGPIQDDAIAKLVETVQSTGLQVKLQVEWDGFTVSPQRVLYENKDLAASLTTNRDPLMCWMIASSVIATEVNDKAWLEILETSEEVSPDLNVKYSTNVSKLEGACNDADLEATKLYARRALTIWHAMAGQHKRIVEAN